MRGVDIIIHPHTGEVISRETYIRDSDGVREWMDDSLIDELVEANQITIIGKFEVD